jgi:flavin reductase (DIM6/NTAB) family NADH-FMN oxidoreductase RutF
MSADSKFRSVAPADLPDNFFSRIGDDWMLITARSSAGEVNTMTASWGCAGILWNKPVAICFIRPQRHTYGIVEDADTLSLSFFPHGEYRDALRYCGTKSGRDGDKFAATGLTVAGAEGGTPYVDEANLVLICRKMYADDLKENCFIDPDMLKHYPAQDYHRFYICEITDVLVRA